MGLGYVVGEKRVHVIARDSVVLVLAIDRDRSLERRPVLPWRGRQVDAKGILDERRGERVSHDVVPRVGERKPERERAQPKPLRRLDAGLIVARAGEERVDREDIGTREVRLPLDRRSQESCQASLRVHRAQSTLGAQPPSLERSHGQRPGPRGGLRQVRPAIRVASSDLRFLRSERQPPAEPRLAAASAGDEPDVDVGAVDDRRATVAGDRLKIRQRLRHVSQGERCLVEPIRQAVGGDVDRARSKRVQRCERGPERAVEDGSRHRERTLTVERSRRLVALDLEGDLRWQDFVESPPDRVRPRGKNCREQSDLVFHSGVER